MFPAFLSTIRPEKGARIMHLDSCARSACLSANFFRPLPQHFGHPVHRLSLAVVIFSTSYFRFAATKDARVLLCFALIREQSSLIKTSPFLKL